MRLLILASWIFLSGQVAHANYSGPNYTDVLTNTQMKFRSDSAYPLYLTGTIKKIYKGPFDTCAIDSEYLKCWEKKTESWTSPVPSDLVNPREVSYASFNTCAIDDEGVKCWSSQSDETPKKKDFINPRNLVSGFAHFCVLTDEGVKCWQEQPEKNIEVPDDLVNPRALFSNSETACALDDNGIKCWGEKVLTPPKDLKNVKTMALGNKHACAVSDTGVKCWGDNTDPDLLEVPSNIKAPTEITAGIGFTCAIENKKVICWGPKAESAPDDLVNPKNLTSNHSVSCVSDNNQIKCWGYSYKETPEIIPPTLNFPKRVVSNGKIACAIDEDFSKCWNLLTNQRFMTRKFQRPREIAITSQLGCVIDDLGLKCWNSAYSNGKSVEGIPNLKNPKSLTIHESEYKTLVCAIHDEGVYCLGSSDFVETFNKYLPKNLKDIKSLHIDLNDACAIDANGLQCWSLYSDQAIVLPSIAKNATGFTSEWILNEGHRWCAISKGRFYCWPKGSTNVSNSSGNAGFGYSAIYNYNKTRCFLSLIAISCDRELFGDFNTDHSDYFPNEKSIPLRYADEIIKSVADNDELAYSFLYLKQKVLESFTKGMTSEVSRKVLMNTRFLQNLYLGSSITISPIVQGRGSLQLRFLLEVMVKSLESSKVLLSQSSKQTIDKLKIDFANVLAEDEITLNQAAQLTTKLFNQKSLIQEMTNSHRLVGIKSFYEWSYRYFTNGAW